MNETEVLEALAAHDAVQRGHFKLSSGLHSDLYVQCALGLQWPGLAERLGHELADKFRDEAPSVVLAPAMGGLVIGQETARGLGVRMIFSERVEGRMVLRRGFTLSPSDRVLVVEDVVTTGRSPKEVVDLVHEARAAVVGVGSIIDRSEEVSFGVRFESLARVRADRWAPETCPLCAEGAPITSPGSRHP